MNPLDWEHTQRRQQRDLDPQQWSGVDRNTGDVSRTSSDRDPYCGYTLEEPHTSMGTNEKWERHSPSSSNLYCKEYAAYTSGRDMDPDGELVGMSEVDQELARKRRQLQEIEEQIMFKKAAIAMKQIEPFLKKNTPYWTFKEKKEEDFAHGKADTSMKKNEPSIQLREEKEESFSYSKGAALKDRVNVILQQRRPLGVPRKVHSPSSDLPHTLLQSPKVASNLAERMNSSSLSKDGLWVEDHPLKLRVMALMRQRRSIPCAVLSNGEVPKVKPLPPSQSPTSTILEENTVSDGFQRFLSVLNKGVDINLLSRIVNDDSEDLPVDGEPLNVQPPVLENKSDVPCRSERQGLHSGALQQDHSRSNSGERRTEPPSREGSHKERHSLPDEKCVQRNDRGDRHFGSSSRSRSPPAVEEKKPRVEEQQRHEQLQNVLKTLGFILEVEEMSKLADRTQERLYGRKHDDRQRLDNRGETASQQSFHRHDRNSPSFTSISGSFSPSPPRRQRSPGRDSRDSRERRKTSECSHSRERSRDKETPQDGDGDIKQAQRHRDRDMDGMDSRESSPGHHSYPKKTTYPSPHPAALAALPEYNLAQYSQYTAYHSGAYDGATNSTWTYTHGAAPPSPCPSGYRYPQNPSYHFSGSEAKLGMVYPYPHPSNNILLEDTRLMLNPDLAESEGQNGEHLRPRCLQVINTKQRCPMRLVNAKTRKRSASRLRRNERFRLMTELERKPETAAKSAALKNVEVPEAPVEASAETRHSEEGKKQPTEQEIKANLKKKVGGTWTNTHGAVPPSPCPSGYRYPQNPSYHFSGSDAKLGMVYPYRRPANNVSLEDAHFMLNPDLAKSEGQNGEQLRLRCLQVINTKTSNRRAKRQMSEVERKTETAAKSAALKSVEVPEAPVEASVETRHSEEGKKKPTEQEIKANLKKKLQAFNQMMKQKATKPAALKNVEDPEALVEFSAETRHSEEGKKQPTEQVIKAILKKKVINTKTSKRRAYKRRAKRQRRYEKIHFMSEVERKTETAAKSAALKSVAVINTKTSKRRATRQRRYEKLRLMREVERKTETAAKSAALKSVAVPEAPVEASAETRHSEEGKKKPTEQEIKANLKKKPQAFNQMMKQKATKPAENSLT